ncbi:uncharacterized protein [Littorina saxatilis]|uniref:N-acetyltransferase domain-containing protein n=1 Tax=Littorina saxatilis TaxID=31220 RepID=A0AAN9B7G7_9CAEN
MMSTSSYPESDEELSEASMDDMQAVVNMCGDVYHGIDYLPSTFPHLLHGPGVKAFVYKVKGELVAFTSTQLQAGGQYLLFLASRVKVAWQGHGIYSRFRRKIFEHFSDKELYPDLRHETVTVTAGNSHAKGGRMRNAGWHLVMTRHSRMRGFEASNLHQLRLKKPTHEVTAMVRDEFLQLLQAGSRHWLHLFPQKRIIHSWKSYVVTEDNLDLILGQS